MSTGISPIEFRFKKYAVGEFCGEKTTKTLNITRKDSGFRAVTGQPFYDLLCRTYAQISGAWVSTEIDFLNLIIVRFSAFV